VLGKQIGDERTGCSADNFFPNGLYLKTHESPSLSYAPTSVEIKQYSESTFTMNKIEEY